MYNSFKQNILEFPNSKFSYLVEDFICSGNNQDAYKSVAYHNERTSNACLIIIGDEYSGKSHLVKIWQELISDSIVFTAEDIKNFSLEQLLEKAFKKNIAIENIEVLTDSNSQDKVFHLYNKAVSENKKILITSRDPLLSIKFILTDLKSRLLSSVNVRINEPDDNMLKIMFSKLFFDLQLKVSNDVIDFLIPRVERNFISIKKLVEEIDEKSIERGRGITIPFVKSALNI